MKKDSRINIALRHWPVLVVAVFLAAGAVVHLVRIFHPFKIEIGATVIPEWASIVGFIAAGTFSALLFWSAFRK